MKKILSVFIVILLICQLFTFGVLAEDTTVKDSTFTGQVTAIGNTATRAKVVYNFLSSLSSGGSNTNVGGGVSAAAAEAAYAKFSSTGASLASQVLGFAGGFPGVSQAFEARKAIVGDAQDSPFNATGLNNFTKMLILSREFFGSPVFGRVGDKVYVNQSSFDRMYNTTNAFLELNGLAALNKSSYYSQAESIASAISALEEGEKAIITKLLSSFSLYSGSSFTFDEFAQLADVDEEIEDATDEELADTVVDAVSDITKDIEEQGQNGSDTSMASSLVEEVVEKAQEKIKVDVKEETVVSQNEEEPKQASADLTSEENNDSVVEAIGKAKELVRDIENGIEGTVDVELKPKAIISAKSGDATVEKSEVKLSSDVFEKSEEKDVTLAIETDVASVEIESGTIDTAAVVDEDTGSTTEIVNVSYKAEKVKTETLTAEQKEEIGTSQVFDFSLVASKKVTDKDGNIEEKEEKVKSTEFKKPVVVKIPYTLKAGETKDNIVVFFINDDTGLPEKNDPKKTSYNSETGILSIVLDHFSKYVIKSNIVKFDDVEDTQWSKRFIEAMASKGVTKGTGDNDFSSKATLTKAEFVTMVTRALAIQNQGVSEPFVDVEEGAWYFNAVKAAYTYNILFDDGKYFNPNDSISRQEMAAIVGKALVMVKKYNMNVSDSYLNQFNDGFLVRGAYKNYVALAIKNNIMSGIPDGEELKFSPNNYTTREMAAKVLYYLYNLD